MTFDFGPYHLDPAKRLLLRSGEPVPLTPKAFDTLVILVERHERVVSKDELLRTFGQDTVVEEASLSQQIFLLRKTLNSGREEAEYIATMRRGVAIASSGRFAHVVSSAPAANGSSRRDCVGRWGGDGRRVRRSRRRSPGVAAILAHLAGHTFVSAAASRHAQLGIARPVARRTKSRVPGADRDGRDLLWIRRFDPQQPLRSRGREEADFPFWSPDGRWLAFFARGKLKKIRADGGLVQVLCDAPWGRGGRVESRRCDCVRAGTEECVVPRSRGRRRATPVTSLAKSPNERSHRFPHFFGDGRHFVYSSLRNDSPRALVIGSNRFARQA
jgi:DNA-binding winged helix-turn-helix (wHTH) protein